MATASRPFDALLLLPASYWVLCAAGCAIIIIYSLEKYNAPSYTQAAIGNLAPLSPDLLAPAPRYRHGLLVYVAWMLVAYGAMCIAGPSVLAIGRSTPETLSATLALWPISAAALLVGSGVASDNNFFGVIEARFRKWSHESAFIPIAAGALTERLAGLDIEKWKEGRTDKIPPLVQEAVKVWPCDLSRLSVTEADWVRANVLYNAVRELKGANYEAAKSRDKDKRALALLSAMRASIVRARESASARKGSAAPDNQLSEDVSAFMEGSAILLASVLMQTGINLREMESTIPGIADFDARAAHPPSVEMIVAGTISFVLFISIFWVMMHASSWLTIHYLEGTPAPKTRFDIVNAITLNALILYGCTFVIGVMVRERYIRQSQWRESLGCYLRLAAIVALITAICASLFTATFLLENPPRQALAHFYINFFVSACAALFLAFHHRDVARSLHWQDALLSRSVGAHMLVAVILTACLILSSGPLLYEKPAEALYLLPPA